jgi:hypothetical protein
MSGIKQISKSNSIEASSVRTDIAFTSLIEEGLEGSTSPPRTEVFYPSTLGNKCDRYMYMAYNGMITGNVIAPRIRRIFDVGNAFEERFEKYLSNVKLLVDRELPIKHESPPISGRIDFIVFPDDPVPVELKTIKQEEYKKLRGPKPEHLLQLQLYLNMGNFKYGYVLYENKNTQNWKCFKLQKDEQLWAEVLDRCNRIIAMSEPPEKCGGNKWCSCREVEV